MTAIGIEFDEFYAAVYSGLVGHVYLLTRDQVEAQDVVQEAFVRALGRWRTVSTMDDPVAWVRRVAVNLAISRWRRQRNALVAWRRRADAAAYAEPGVDRVALVAVLRALPPRQRAAVTLHYVADLPVAVVAQELGVPEGTVKSDLSRARARLAAALGDGEEMVVR